MKIRSALYTILIILAFSFQPVFAEEPQPAIDRDVPVAPIKATVFRGWTNTYKLNTEHLTVIVVPDTGRLSFIGPNAELNLLRLDEGLAGQGFPETDDGNWRNFGGDWLWPVAQSHWASFQTNDWPPSRLLDGTPWTGRAWKNADGVQCALLTKTYGPPLNLEVSRTIKVPPDQPHFTIEQRAERTAASTIPVTLWNISQVGGAEHVIIPTEDTSAYTNGFRPMMFGIPETNVLSLCEGALVYDASKGGEAKLCSDSKGAWIAAVRKQTLLLEQAVGNQKGTFPDGGCSVEMYANSGLGYAEIETLSIEKVLAEGESLENVLHIHVLPVASPSTQPCILGQEVIEHITE
jgi:hypothetical protein